MNISQQYNVKCSKLFSNQKQRWVKPELLCALAPNEHKTKQKLQNQHVRNSLIMKHCEQNYNQHVRNSLIAKHCERNYNQHVRNSPIMKHHNRLWWTHRCHEEWHCQNYCGLYAHCNLLNGSTEMNVPTCNSTTTHQKTSHAPNHWQWNCGNQKWVSQLNARKHTWKIHTWKHHTGSC